MFGDATIAEADDVDGRDLEGLPARRGTHERPKVRAADGEVHRQPVAIGDGLADLSDVSAYRTDLGF